MTSRLNRGEVGRARLLGTMQTSVGANKDSAGTLWEGNIYVDEGGWGECIVSIGKIGYSDGSHKSRER